MTPKFLAWVTETTGEAIKLGMNEKKIDEGKTFCRYKARDTLGMCEWV